MPEPNAERMDALSEALARMVRRQEEVDRRLAEIERALGISRPAPVEAHVEAPIPPPTEAPPPPPLPVEAAPPPLPIEAAPPTPTPQLETPQLETKLGLAWVNRIGAVTMALCVAFIFKYAVDNAWIGPGGRVALGVLAGLGAIAAAERTYRSGQKTYAQGISGLGVVILYLSFYASFGFYHLIEPGFAFALMAMATATAGLLALRHEAPAIAALGLVGGFATPVLLSTGQDRPWALFTWILLLDLCAVAAARLRRWRAIESLAFAGTALLYGAWLDDRFTAEKQTVAVLFAFVFYALFAISETAPLFYFAHALAAIAMSVIWKYEIASYAASALVLVGAGLTIADRRNRAYGISVVFGAFCAAYWIWEHPSPYAVGSAFLFLTVAFVIFLGWLPWRVIVRGAPFARQDALAFVLNGAFYFGVCYDLLRPDYRAWLGLFAVAVAAAHLAVAYLIWTNRPEGSLDTRAALLAIGIALTLVTLAAPIQFSEYRITMAWALEMAALAWIGRRAASNGMLYASLAVFLLTLFRLVAIDSWSLAAGFTPFANARFLTFVIAAAASWAAAYFTGAIAQSAVVYLGGHFIMLWGLGLEAVAWVDRRVVQNQLSAESAAVSILMACYAVLLIAIGVAKRSALNRIVGLGLIGLVVVKLYLYDVWLLDRIYRIGAFGALGALLLLTSYVYSRNRASIENWWNDRTPRA